MLTGDPVRVQVSKQQVIPLYPNRKSPRWLETAESLLAVFRDLGAARDNSGRRKGSQFNINAISNREPGGWRGPTTSTQGRDVAQDVARQSVGLDRLPVQRLYDKLWRAAILKHAFDRRR
jgi:hypothetical protein